MHAHVIPAEPTALQTSGLHAVPARTIAVLDGAGGWEEAAAPGIRVAERSPRDATATEMEAVGPVQLVVNLVRPGALEALRALRRGGCAVPAAACLAGAGRALLLGAVEVLDRPLDGDQAWTALGTHASRGTKLVTVGPDVDALVGLRYTLTQRGISVAMAWDARQAAELMALVRPSVAVVDLALPGREGFEVIARMAGNEPPPALAILPGDEDPAPGFGAALAHPAHGQRAVSLERLLGKLAGRV